MRKVRYSISKAMTLAPIEGKSPSFLCGPLSFLCVPFLSMPLKLAPQNLILHPVTAVMPRMVVFSLDSTESECCHSEEMS